MLNRVILIGRLVADPEAKYTPSGIAVTQFRIAVDRPLSAEARAQGQEKQADFIDIVAWRQNAEFAANYLSKGRLVAVEGKLQIREYVSQDGQRRKSAEIVADNLKGLDRPKDQEGGDEGRSGYAEPQARPAGGGIDRGAGRPATGGARGTSAPPGATGRGGGSQDPFDSGDDLSDPFAE